MGRIDVCVQPGTSAAVSTVSQVPATTVELGGGDVGDAAASVAEGVATVVAVAAAVGVAAAAGAVAAGELVGGGAAAHPATRTIANAVTNE